MRYLSSQLDEGGNFYMLWGRKKEGKGGEKGGKKKEKKEKERRKKRGRTED
jgi:hypothetical protein